MGVGTRNETLDPHPNLPPARGKAPELLLAPPAIPWTNPSPKNAPRRTKKILCLSPGCRTSAPFNDRQFLQRTRIYGCYLLAPSPSGRGNNVASQDRPEPRLLGAVLALAAISGPQKEVSSKNSRRALWPFARPRGPRIC